MAHLLEVLLLLLIVTTVFSLVGQGYNASVHVKA